MCTHVWIYPKSLLTSQFGGDFGSISQLEVRLHRPLDNNLLYIPSTQTIKIHLTSRR